MSAILLPHDVDGGIDWPAVEAHVDRTVAAGLVPAVNMDTGYVQLLDDADRRRVLDLTAELTGGRFVAGAYVADGPGDGFDLARHATTATAVAARGGTPVVFPSHGLNALDDEEWVRALAALGAEVDRFIGFELSPLFVPYGRIVSLDAYRGMLEIRAAPERSTPRSAARRSGTASSCATPSGRRSWCSPATTWPSTW
jgi:hypothetical protein